MAINQEYFINIFPLMVTLSTQLSSVDYFFWVLDIYISARLTLPDGVLFHFIPNWVFVANVLRAHILIESDIPFPRPNLHSCEPDHFLFGSSHVLWPHTFIPCSKLLTFSIDPHLFIFIDRVVNWEIDSISFPNVFKADLRDLYGLFCLTILNLMETQ